MTLHPVWRLALAGCLLCFSIGCDSSSAGAGGAAGSGGAGGSGGMVTTPPVVPGLWEWESDGVRLCFYVSADGLELSASSECNLAGSAEGGARSFNAQVELIGRDETGQPCSFELAYSGSVSIDPVTGAFGVANIGPIPGGGPTTAFSGEIQALLASGVAQAQSGDSTCTVGWEAHPASPCDEDAINSCLDLQDCCRAILVNPVFFESCNSVVLQCDQANCLRVLEGYPQCSDL